MLLNEFLESIFYSFKRILMEFIIKHKFLNYDSYFLAFHAINMAILSKKPRRKVRYNKP